jgi:hypothetical protein
MGKMFSVVTPIFPLLISAIFLELVFAFNEMPMARGQKQVAQVPLNQTLYQKANADGVAETASQYKHGWQLLHLYFVDNFTH